MGDGPLVFWGREFTFEYAAVTMRLSTLCLFFTVLVAESQAAEKWIRATSEHFELYTPQSERKARETLLYFEQVRDFFQGMMNARPDDSIPVRIVLFANEKQYQPFRPSEVAAAYYQQAYDRDYIVMGGYSPEADRIATHEYMHLLIRHLGLRPPLWLDEGLAELYSTLKPAGGKMLIGDLIRGHMIVLNQEKWIPLEQLFQIGPDSKEYNTKAPAGVLYAESWALLHMLNLAEEYRGKGGDVLARIEKNTLAGPALEKAFGKKLWDLELDLRSYVSKNNRFVGALFPFKWDKSRETVEVAPVGAQEVGAMLALVHVNAGHYDVAKAQLEALAAEDPNSAAVAEARGYYAWHRQDWPRAQENLRKAVSLAANPSAKLLYDAGRVEQLGGARSTEAAGLLERAMKARPDWLEPRITLAEHYVFSKQPQAALDLLTGAKGVKPRIAPRLFRALGYSEAMLGRIPAARLALERARQYTKESFDQEQNQRLADYLERREKFKQAEIEVAELRRAAAQREELPEELDPHPPALRPKPLPPPGPETPTGPIRDPRLQEATGKLTNLQCRGEQAILTVETKQGPLYVAILDPKMVTIQGGAGAEVEFVCGPQQKIVRVEYLPGEDTKYRTQGLVRLLEFR